MTEALLLRLQAESAMWRERGDAHLCALLDDASAVVAPPAAATVVPLTEAQAEELWRNGRCLRDGYIPFIRAIERACAAAWGVTLTASAAKGEAL